MRKLSPLLGSVIFLLIAPGMVGGVIPLWISGWRLQPALFGMTGPRIVGVCLICIGAAVLLDSFMRFAVQGLGTPAPVYPTRHLVITGLYCYVRNPMYIAVLAVVFGQGLLLGSRGVIVYAASIAVLFHLFVIVYEEPALTAAFGSEYSAFRSAVPRWIPRLRRWKP